MKLNKVVALLLGAVLTAAAAETVNNQEQDPIEDLRQTLSTKGVQPAADLIASWDGQPSVPAAVRLAGHYGLAEFYAEKGDTAQAIQQFEAAASAARQANNGDAILDIQHELTMLKEIGQPLPRIHGTAIDGRSVDTAQLQGKVVLVQFFASWCGPCRAEAPEIDALNKKYAGAGLQIVGVSLDDDAAALRQYLTAQPVAWPVLADYQGWAAALARQFDVTSIPESILVDRNGGIVRRGLRGDDLDQAVGKLLTK